MAARTAIFVLVIVQLVMVSSRINVHFVRMVYQPYGPRMCQEICQDEAGSFSFVKEDLSCWRLKANYSCGRGRDSVTTDSTPKVNANRSPLTPRTERLKCFDQSEDVIKTERAFKAINNERVKFNQSYILHKACFFNNLCKVRFMLSQGLADINVRGNRGRTPIMVAASKGHAEVVNLLVSHGCDLSLVDDDHNNVLHTACGGGNCDIVKTLVLNYTLDTESKGGCMMTPVMLASHYNHTDVFDFLVSIGCSLIEVDCERNNILHIASSIGNVDMVKYILNNTSLDINSKSGKGRTPVMTAAGFGHIEVVELLVHNGCSLTEIDNMQNNILHLACFWGHTELVKYILSRTCCNVDSRGFAGRTPIMMGVWNGHKDVFDLLERKGCNVTVLDDDMNNLLHLACMYGHSDIVLCIISKGIIDIESRGWKGRTPMITAARYGQKAVVVSLRSKGGSVTAVDSERNTALHLASSHGHVSIVKYLLSLRETDKNVQNMDGRTPLQVAEVEGHLRVVSLLDDKK